MRRLNLTGNGERVARHSLDFFGTISRYRRPWRSSQEQPFPFAAIYDTGVRKASGLRARVVDKLEPARKCTCKHLHKGKLAVLWILQHLKANASGRRHQGIVLLAVYQRNAAKVGHSWEPAGQQRQEGRVTLSRTQEPRRQNKNAHKQPGPADPQALPACNLSALKVAHHHLSAHLNNQLGQRRGQLRLCLELSRNTSVPQACRLPACVPLMDNVNDAGERLRQEPIGTVTAPSESQNEPGVQSQSRSSHQAIQAVDKQCAAETGPPAAKPKPGSSARSTS